MCAVPKKNAFPIAELEKASFLISASRYTILEIIKTQRYFAEIICSPMFVFCAKICLSVNLAKRPTVSRIKTKIRKARKISVFK